MTFKILAVRWCELFRRDRDQQQLLNDLSTKFQLVIFSLNTTVDDIHEVVPFCHAVTGVAGETETDLCQRVIQESRRLQFETRDLFYLNVNNKPNPEVWHHHGTYDPYTGIVRDDLPLIVLKALGI